MAVDLVKQDGFRQRLRGSQHHGRSAAESHFAPLPIGDICCAPVSGDLGDQWPKGEAGGIPLCGITDNAGNASSMTKMMTTKFPLVIMLV